jgi:hypothetical protein
MRAISQISVVSLLLGSLMLILMFADITQAQETPTVSVCDVMQNLEKLSGNLINVRGEVYFSREILALGQRTCTSVYETDGRKWGNALSLVFSSRAATNPLSKTVDRRPLEFLDTVIRTLTNLYWRTDPLVEPPYQIFATFEGVLQTRSPEYRALHGPLGFGHLGMYPAQLEVTNVKDVTINPRPAN